MARADAKAEEKEEEKKPADATEQEGSEEDELVGGVFKMITAKNASELLSQQSKRIIYLYKDSEGIGPVAQFAMQLARSMQVEPLLLDCKNEGDMAAVMEHFKQ